MTSTKIKGKNMRIRSKEFNWDEAMEMAESMLHLSTVLQPMQKEADRRDRKLKKFPKGFHLEGKGYTCSLCRDSCSEEDTWYDQYGEMVSQSLIERVSKRNCLSFSIRYIFWITRPSSQLSLSLMVTSLINKWCFNIPFIFYVKKVLN